VKDELAEFVRAHPEVLDLYKSIKGALGPPSDDDLDKGFNAKAFAEALATRLREIAPGHAGATAYQELMSGILTFLFYPNLIYPVKEQPLHGGRKRIDIKFTNGATGGFFERALKSKQMRAISVVVECKNYAEEIGNPELDQLAGRFGHSRGFLGISLSRTAASMSNVIQRCADAAGDGRGFLIPLVDIDVFEMLENAGRGQDSLNDYLLQRRLDEITHK
jgi:hypothetical protein